MDLSSANILNLSLLMFWVLLWALGGIWISNRIFRLQRREKVLIGLFVGFVSQIWLTNMLCYVLDALPAFWLSTSIVFLTGFLLSIRNGWR